MVHSPRQHQNVTGDTGETAKSLRRFACFGVAIAILAASGIANAAPQRPAAGTSAQASVTIAHPAAIRSAAFEAHGGWDTEAAGTDIAPIGESRRDCSDDNRERCGLVVFDMP
ncbi:MAG: hypothetical protein HKN78_09430 [Sphingomonadaceae bacterium]|nr:hypothetical protein [Sphingomonadaceae bacterium]